jgi:hypothetical protein
MNYGALEPTKKNAHRQEFAGTYLKREKKTNNKHKTKETNKQANKQTNKPKKVKQTKHKKIRIFIAISRAITFCLRNRTFSGCRK